MNFASYDNLTNLLPLLANKIGGGIKSWSASTSYTVDEIVIYGNSLYKCTTAHTSTSTFDSTKWQELGGGGGVNAIIDTLWEGLSYQIGDTLTLSNPITDYDYLVFYLGQRPADCHCSMLYRVGKEGYVSLSRNNGTFQRWGGSLQSNSTTNFSCDSADGLHGTFGLYRIEGIKFLNPNVYSTTEQRIGTWIDGKPLYQKTYRGEITISANTDTELFDYSDLGDVEVLDARGYGLTGAFLGYYYNSIYYNCFWIENRKGMVRTSTPATNSRWNVTIQYIKTTD